MYVLSYHTAIFKHRLVIKTYLKINNRIRYVYVSFIHGHHGYIHPWPKRVEDEVKVVAASNAVGMVNNTLEGATTSISTVVTVEAAVVEAAVEQIKS